LGNSFVRVPFLNFCTVLEVILTAGRPRKPLELQRNGHRTKAELERYYLRVTPPTPQELAARRAVFIEAEERAKQRYFERHGITWEEHMREGIS
jgi:hypothetical protein